MEQSKMEMILSGLVSKDFLKENFDDDSDKLVYNLTDKGFEQAKEYVQEDDRAAVLAFSFIFNQFANSRDDVEPQKAIFYVCKLFKDKYDVNMLRKIWRNENMIEGFSFNRKPPEGLVKAFEPE